MKIGVYSKFGMAGGSEFRCAEMANSILKFTDHTPYLMSEKDFPSRIKEYAEDDVELVPNVFLPEPKNMEKLYEMDHILVVNTDCKNFTTLDYWAGKSERHGVACDLSKIKHFVFLFNFIVSPSRKLYEVSEAGPDVSIITANTKFFDEISEQDRYERVRLFPRMQLESPINPELYTIEKKESDKIRIGMHSKGVGNKWNDDWQWLIKKMNERLGDDRVIFDFMGMPGKLSTKLKAIKNVIARPEDHVTVRDYLSHIDVFCFFPSWGREEPWGRVVGEAMMSGCPIVTTNKGGNLDQVVEGHNGFLCKNKDTFFKRLIYLVEHPNVIECMGYNSERLAKNFTSERVVEKFIRFIED